VEAAAGLEPGVLDGLDGGLELAAADRLVENTIGLYALPLAIATNFIIDGRERLIPMVIEEPSVVAAASNAARRARLGGGFTTSADPPITLAQIEIREVKSALAAEAALLEAQSDILDEANALHPDLVARGGGCRGLQLRWMSDASTLVIHLLVDCRDAMGANLVNSIAEAMAPRLAALAGGAVGLRILSNLAVHRLARARCRLPAPALARRGVSGEAARDGVIAASRLAEWTPPGGGHSGIINGIDAVAITTGNDWRGPGRRSHLCGQVQYSPLSRWWADDQGALLGEIEMPLPLATVGGATRLHPSTAITRRILGVAGASDLARIAAAVGLAQNLAALAALGAEGIQEGHMILHRRSSQ
jgi:hydroxymethylglutaryl-CoA reductase